MTFGLNITNIAGDFIVDGTRPNFEIKEYGISSVEPDPDGIGIFGAFMPPTTDGLYLIRPPYNTTVGMMNYYTANYPIMSYDNNFVQTHPYTTSIKYARANPVTSFMPGSELDFGIQVRGEGAQPLFSSDQRMFFVDAVLTVYQMYAGAWSQSIFNFNLPAPEYGERYFQLITRQDTGEYGGDSAIGLTMYSETSAQIQLFGPPSNTWGAGMIQSNIVKICTGYFQ